MKEYPEAEEVCLGCARSAQDDAVETRFTASLGHRAPVDSVRARTPCASVPAAWDKEYALDGHTQERMWLRPTKVRLSPLSDA